MSIDLHETAATTQKAAKRAHKRAVTGAAKGVEAARSVEFHVPDLHVPAKAAKKAAKHAAKAAAKEAAKRTAGVSRHTHRKQKQKSKSSNKLLRFVLIVATAGALATIATVARRQAAGNKGLAVGDTPDPFGAAVNATDGVDADALLRHAESPG